MVRAAGLPVPRSPTGKVSAAGLAEAWAAADPASRAFPELVAPGFWARHANIERLRTGFAGGHPAVLRSPRGLAFHVAPSNVDTIFVYSLLLSMLAGNNNIVRISSRAGEQSGHLLNVIDRAIAAAGAAIRARIAIVRYEHDKAINRCAVGRLRPADRLGRGCHRGPGAHQPAGAGGAHVLGTASNRVRVVRADGLAGLGAAAAAGNGFLREYRVDDLGALMPQVALNGQTIVSHGIAGDDWRAALAAARPPGIDRIVKVGQALDFDAIWDGVDLLTAMTRMIAIAA